jgi:hypothetical protein
MNEVASIRAMVMNLELSLIQQCCRASYILRKRCINEINKNRLRQCMLNSYVGLR